MEPTTIRIRIQGPDHPGITAALMSLLTGRQARIEDVEQVVIRGHLSLSLVVKVAADDELRGALLLFGYQQKVEIDFDEVSSTPTKSSPVLVATLLGADVTPREFGVVASTVADNGGNIDRIIRLAKYPVMAYELTLSGQDREALRTGLLARAHELSCDMAVHRFGLSRRAKRLVVLDVDSTLIRDEAIELLAAAAGSLPEVAELTERAMAGELDFAEALADRVKTLAGLDASHLDRMNSGLRLTPGARTFIRTLRKLGYRTAVVSGGFTSVTDHLQAELGIDYGHANQLEIVDGKLTGRTTGPIVDRAEKAEFVRAVAAKEGIALDQVVAVGDGANDLDMLSTAGLGIAFNAKQVVRDAADTTLNVPYLDAVLFVLGISRDEILEADAIDAA